MARMKYMTRTWRRTCVWNRLASTCHETSLVVIKNTLLWPLLQLFLKMERHQTKITSNPAHMNCTSTHAHWTRKKNQLRITTRTTQKFRSHEPHGQSRSTASVKKPSTHVCLGIHLRPLHDRVIKRRVDQCHRELLK